MEILQGSTIVDQFVIKRVSVNQILDLRHRVLRAGLPIDTAKFNGDNNNDTLHFGTFFHDTAGQPYGDVLCCASFIKSSWEEHPAYQLRGMATATDFQGKGIGRRLLSFAEEMIRLDTGIHLFWCNSRESAIGFYDKLGWHIASETFYINGNIPHKRMWK